MAIEQSGKSKRAVSIEAGCGPGYVHSILAEGKEPTVDRLIAVAKALNVSLSWLLYGYHVSPEVEDLLRLLEDRPEAVDALKQILKRPA